MSLGVLDDPSLAPILAALPRARLVGGAVRDSLAGRPVIDFDLATPDPPERVMRALEAAGVRAVPTGLAHGTVTAVGGRRPVEITTLRRDAATDGRHASVEWTDDWREDAARRDFTINAMSMDRAGTLFDYFGGAADLRAGRVRFVGDAASRIAEDYLRILRYFRFRARYGRGGADPETEAAISGGVPGLARLSPERVWSELKNILRVAEPRGVVSDMERLGVLAAILPEGAGTGGLARLVEAGAPADPVLRLAALAPAGGVALAERLRLSGAERDRLLALGAGPVAGADADDAALRRLLADEPADVLSDRSFLAGRGSPALAARLVGMARPVFPLEGRDALALGASAGPVVGEALRRTRAWWLEAGCAPDREACLVVLSTCLGAGA